MTYRFKTAFATAGLFVLVSLFSPVRSGWGQDYTVMPVNDSFDLAKIVNEPEAGGDPKRAESILRQRISKQQQNASQVFRTGEINNQFRAYYTQVVVPELTRYDRQSLLELTDKHQKILKDFATRIRAQNVYAYLVTEVFFPMLSEIVDGAYHPAVRYNAILTLGKLDEVIGKHRVAAPRPYRESLPYLIKKYNEFNDPNLAFLKYGAFKGIARIAGIEFQKGSPAADAAKPILTALLAAPPADVDRDLYLAMQKVAVITLGLLGDPANAAAFARLIEDENVPIWTRAEAAVAFSKIKSNSMDAAQVESVANSMAKFMHDVLRQEVTHMDDTQQRIAVLATRKQRVSLDGPVGDPSSPSSGPSGSGDLFAGDSPSAGGSSSGASSRGGSNSSGSGSSGSSAPSMGQGGGGPQKKRASVGLTELPEYRIELTRRRIKTIALNLLSAFGETSGSTGMLRWANGNASLLPKLSKIKTHMLEADRAAEVGLSSQSVIAGGVTDSLRDEFNNVADKIAETLGLNKQPGKQPGPAAPAKGKAGEKQESDDKKSSSDPFLNNQ